MNVEIPCTVKKIEAPRTSASGFRWRELVVEDETDPRFPQTYPVTFSRGRTDVLDALAPGDAVTVHATLRGREHDGRHYLSLDGWKIERMGADGKMHAVEAPKPAAEQPPLPFGPSPAPAAAPPVFPPSPPTTAPAPRPPAPFDATRTYAPGDRALFEGRVYVYQARPGAAPWTLAPEAAGTASPAGKVEDLPF